MTISRRTLLRSSLGFIAAPAIIRVADIMPVKAWAEPEAVFPHYSGSRTIFLHDTEWNVLAAHFSACGYNVARVPPIPVRYRWLD